MKILCGLFKIVCILGLLLAAGQPKPALAVQEAPVVTTPFGPVRGLSGDDGVSVFKGIPYAKPPLGALRFAPTETVEPWRNVLDCREFGNIAVQVRSENSLSSADLKMSEDCLTLNIWAPPRSESGEKLPVYVFIHGGGYATGSGAIPIYDGTGFARNGIVAVTLNYRLNALGFLPSAETFRQYGTTGNWGHLDQIKALEWIRKSIASFGGDPDNITIGGESAGSYSVSALILSPLAKGLFHKAIMESGTILSAPVNTYYAKGDLERGMIQGAIISSIFGAQDDAEGLNRLRRADAAVLAQLTRFDANLTNVLAFFLMPTFDGAVLPADPLAALEAGDYNRVKVLLGFNGNEGSLFIPAGTDADRYKMMVTTAVGPEKAEQVLARLPVTGEYSAGERLRLFQSYGMFISGMKMYADAMSDRGLDVYGYYFTHPIERTAESGLGATHALELPFVFNNLAAMDIEGARHQRLAEEMHLRWVNFIKTGDPNRGELSSSKVVWPKYRKDRPELIRFDDTVEVVGWPDPETAAFMQKIFFDR